MSTESIIYGVSLGPGDPDLITLKGLKVLQEADKIYYPGSLYKSGEKASYALSILEHYKLDSNKFILSDEDISNVQAFTDFTKVIRIWSTQETHKATARSGATFSEALCEVLEENPRGVKMDSLERILNEHWKEKQRHHPKLGRVVYKCKVDINSDYEFMFPCK